jgi:hypothetical protein
MAQIKAKCLEDTYSTLNTGKNLEGILLVNVPAKLKRITLPFLCL